MVAPRFSVRSPIRKKACSTTISPACRSVMRPGASIRRHPRSMIQKQFASSPVELRRSPSKILRRRLDGNRRRISSACVECLSKKAWKPFLYFTKCSSFNPVVFPRSFPGRTRPGNFMRHYAPCVAAVCNAVRELFSDPADLVSCHSLCAQGDILTVLETLLRAVSNFSLL